MRIAVPFENGMIFQHFGKSEEFKIYDVENGTVVSSEIVNTNGTGHEAIAGFLAERGVQALVCGGIGGGAQDALTQAGIEVCSGAAGSVDLAVDAYLRGDLVSAGVNCDHHDHEEGEEHECGSCGGGCGGCGGCGGGAPRIMLEGKNAGKICSVHYTGTFDDGTVFDSSYDRSEPLTFICGGGQMILGFDKAVLEMEVGETKEVHLMPEEAYGEKNPDAVFAVKISEMPGAEDVNAGEKVYLYNNAGQPFPVTVAAKTDTDITFDANHEMAGKELNFKIELIEVK